MLNRASLSFVFVASSLALLVPACGGSGGSGDARCVALCTIKEPSTPNAGDVCSQASADTCLELCGARIEGTGAVCSDCLLEDAYFGLGSSGGGGNDCVYPSSTCGTDGECTEVGPAGSCTYCASDSAAYQDCYAQVHPRREVACDVDFRDAAECSALCAAAQ